MAKYLLLRVEDDQEADALLRDIVLYPHSPLRTPSQEEPVMVELVPDLDEADFIPDEPARISRLDSSAPQRARGLRAVLRKSYLRASELAAEWEASA